MLQIYTISELFAQLRELRLELAKKEKVPPYIVFSDKTLAQMCLLKPRTKAKMLEVGIHVPAVKASVWGFYTLSGRALSTGMVWLEEGGREEDWGRGRNFL